MGVMKQQKELGSITLCVVGSCSERGYPFPNKKWGAKELRIEFPNHMIDNIMGLVP